MSKREGTGPEASMSMQNQVERPIHPPDDPRKGRRLPRQPGPEPSRWTLVWAIVLGTSVFPLGIGLMTVVGLGVVRELPSWAISYSSLLLLVLPAMGIAAVFRNRLLGFAVGFWVWPVLLFSGIPLFFPGERSGAMVSGASWLASVGGEDFERAAAQSVQRLADSLGEGSQLAVPPPEEAEPLQAFLRPLFDEEDGAGLEEKVFLPYEGSDRERKVAVILEGPNGQSEEVWMLFDTGATMTTVHPDVLRRLGVSNGPSNPVMRFQTANGERRDSVALLDTVWMAGLGVDGVSVASCESCATEGSVGLLGLNVSGQFQVTLDPARRVIVLIPNSATPDRQIDVSPWLELEGTFRELGGWPGGSGCGPGEHGCTSHSGRSIGRLMRWGRVHRKRRSHSLRRLSA